MAPFLMTPSCFCGIGVISMGTKARKPVMAGFFALFAFGWGFNNSINIV